MDKIRTKKTKHNHSRNLEAVLNEFRQRQDQGGVHLEDLALKCKVSIRQIYRYLNELQNMGYDIVKMSDPNSNCCGGYILLDTEPNQNVNITLTNILSDLEKIKVEIHSAKLFVNELLIRNCMMKLGIMLPLTTQIQSFDQEDAITVNHQMFVYRSTVEEHWEDIRIKASPKVVNHVVKTLSSEVKLQQRLRDGWFNLNLRTKRVKQITGILTQWGSDVEVIEPGWLKHKMLENCKAILYADRLKKVDKKDVFLPDGHYLVNN